MCNFLSWIEVDEKNGNKKLLYLTDKDIYSSYGREVLQGSQGSDFLGHGAIRAYYGKDGVPFNGGIDREVNDF